MIKLIALDMDWTLIDYSSGKGTICPELMEFFKEFINKGNHAGIISGRPPWEFGSMVESCGYEFSKPFPDFMVAREAYLWEYDTNYVDITELNCKTKDDIHELNLSVSTHLNDIIKMLKSKGIAISNFCIYGEFATEIHVEASKADFAMGLVSEYVKEHNIPNAKVHRNGVMVTIYHKNYGKGNTLKKVSKYYGVEPHEVLAIGDNYNDVSMIDGKIGFIGACVGNAVDDIKNIVKSGGGYVGNGTASVGVMDIIKQLQKEGKI